SEKNLGGIPVLYYVCFGTLDTVFATLDFTISRSWPAVAKTFRVIKPKEEVKRSNIRGTWSPWCVVCSSNPSARKFLIQKPTNYRIPVGGYFMVFTI
ncbi:hypothetical protein AVEN_265858-1, partial [Araneus ventricosus]